jgi:hypothetical protein
MPEEDPYLIEKATCTFIETSYGSNWYCFVESRGFVAEL